MLYTKKTKIVATIGPASSSRERIKELIAAGVNVFRINFSHAQHEETKQIISDIRELSDLTNTGIAILADLQGPKLDRKSTRLNSSHVAISYAVFCLKKKKKK